MQQYNLRFGSFWTYSVAEIDINRETGKNSTSIGSIAIETIDV